MNQALYAHMNNKRKRKKIIKKRNFNFHNLLHNRGNLGHRILRVGVSHRIILARLVSIYKLSGLLKQSLTLLSEHLSMQI
jgi:hypothetical protein